MRVGKGGTGYISVSARQLAMCVILCFCNLCGQTLRLLASVYHHVNLQCIGESGGSVIVLLAAVWLFSDMLPHLVLS